MSDKDVCPYFEYISFRLFQADKQTNCTYNSREVWTLPYIINYNSQPIAEAPRTAAAASSSELTKNFGLSLKISKACSL